MTLAVEHHVAQHYTHGNLEKAILDALVASGKDLSRLQAADLSPVDEFHIGGRQATIDFAAFLPFRPGSHLLDVGCGLGGASRYFAEARGCRVTGIDLTEEYVKTAQALAQRVGLGDGVTYQQGSALDLPFPDGAFDGPYMFHVGMNIADKERLFGQVRKVLQTGGTFGIYDVMRERDGDLSFPVPWATTPETSSLDNAATYRRALDAAGFSITHERSRREFAIDFFRKLRAGAAQNSGPPHLGLQILLGASAPQKVAHMLGSLEAGLFAPTEIVAVAK